MTGTYLVGRGVNEWIDNNGFTTNEDRPKEEREEDVVDAYWKAWKHWVGDLANYKGDKAPTVGSDAARFDLFESGWGAKNFERFKKEYKEGEKESFYNDIFLEARDEEKLAYMRAWKEVYGEHKNYKGEDMPADFDIFNNNMLGDGWGKKNWERFEREFTAGKSAEETLEKAVRALISSEDWETVYEYVDDYFLRDDSPGNKW